MESFDEVPLGYTFKPSDVVLITHYLLRKVTGRPLSSDLAITECDVYGREELWKKMFDKRPNAKALYFFTHLKKKANGKKNMDRCAGPDTTWRNQSETKIFTQTKLHVGCVTHFSLINNASRKATKEWVMHEYRLSDHLLTATRVHFKDEYVICKIKRKKLKGAVPASESTSSGLGDEYQTLVSMLLSSSPVPTWPNNNTCHTTLPSSESTWSGSGDNNQTLPVPTWPIYNTCPVSEICGSSSATSAQSQLDDYQSTHLSSSPDNYTWHTSPPSYASSSATSAQTQLHLSYSSPPPVPDPFSLPNNNNTCLQYDDSVTNFTTYPTLANQTSNTTSFHHDSLTPHLTIHPLSASPLSSINHEQLPAAPQPPAQQDITTLHKALNDEEMAQVRLIAQMDWHLPAQTPYYPSLEDYDSGDIFTF